MSSCDHLSPFSDTRQASLFLTLSQHEEQDMSRREVTNIVEIWTGRIVHKPSLIDDHKKLEFLGVLDSLDSKLMN